MQKLQCELCGSVDIVRTDGGFFKCQHCGCKYTLEQAKALLSTVETTIGKAELERLLKNAKTYYDLKQFYEAKKTYDEITKQFPDDYRGWLGLLRLEYRDYMYDSHITPTAGITEMLQKHFNICKKLCTSEKTVDEINKEWEHFWNYMASQCISGKFTYGGGDPEVFKSINPAMYELSKVGFENERILNSLDVWPRDGHWFPKNPNYGSFKYYFGYTVMMDGSTGTTDDGEIAVPVIDDAYVAKIKAEVQKYINEKLSHSKCPYCDCYLKKNIFGTKCPSCGRKF